MTWLGNLKRFVIDLLLYNMGFFLNIQRIEYLKLVFMVTTD